MPWKRTLSDYLCEKVEFWIVLRRVCGAFNLFLISSISSSLFSPSSMYLYPHRCLSLVPDRSGEIITSSTRRSADFHVFWAALFLVARRFTGSCKSLWCVVPTPWEHVSTCGFLQPLTHYHQTAVQWDERRCLFALVLPLMHFSLMQACCCPVLIHWKLKSISCVCVEFTERNIWSLISISGASERSERIRLHP